MVAAGAGMSVDSGLPDYRSKEGFWNEFLPYKELKRDYAEMATPRGFMEDPEFAWGFFAHQLNLFRSTTPHNGYNVLHNICKNTSKSFFVVTTNVDGHFLKAGFPAAKVHECHGTIHKLQCISPCNRKTWSANELYLSVDTKHMRLTSPIPRCPNCNNTARPNIFMFGDTKYVWEEAQPAADRFRDWLQNNMKSKLIILEIGAGLGAPGLRNHCEEYCREVTCSTLIRINKDYPETPRPHDVSIKATATDALSAIWDHYQ